MYHIPLSPIIQRSARTATVLLTKILEIRQPVWGKTRYNRRMNRYLMIMLTILLTGCGSLLTPTPTHDYALGETLLREDFTESFAWQHYVNPDLKVDFQVIDGAYRARAWDEGFIWTIQPPAYTDVVIEVEAAQLSDDRTNFYGVMCRASPNDNGDGYYFLITAFGEYSIRRGAVDQINALIPFTSSAAIRQDRGINRIRAVCIGDYLALYVNDQFVAETRDDYFSRGYAGLTAAAADDAEVEIIFDDLTIWAAELR